MAHCATISSRKLISRRPSVCSATTAARRPAASPRNTAGLPMRLARSREADAHLQHRPVSRFEQPWPGRGTRRVTYRAPDPAGGGAVMDVPGASRALQASWPDLIRNVGSRRIPDRARSRDVEEHPSISSGVAVQQVLRTAAMMRPCFSTSPRQELAVPPPPCCAWQQDGPASSPMALSQLAPSRRCRDRARRWARRAGAPAAS
jgi:hypothetical protein